MQRVLQKLEAIAHAIEQSGSADEQNEETATRTFNTVLGELTDVRDRLSTDYNQSSNLQHTRQNDLVSTRMTHTHS